MDTPVMNQRAKRAGSSADNGPFLLGHLLRVHPLNPLVVRVPISYLSLALVIFLWRK